MNFYIKSLYLCVKDMNRAIKFYEDFFEQPVTEKDDIYSVFDIKGFRLGLFDFKKVNETHIFGNNCLPSIEVENLDMLKNKLFDKKIVFKITKIGNNWVSEFEDSEGNHIELTAPII
ncbi:VOC family protein [Miniphocaeibacter massiliensis]|uniref:VOC family protein n=1 Tax=Miniphocaeibacter massiliensis TaxID=2041841 RepID=UPI000C1C7528|nr:VOC family protein [Miniphocaeibacter massiliensis]